MGPVSRQTPKDGLCEVGHGALGLRRAGARCMLTQLMSKWAGLGCLRGAPVLPLRGPCPAPSPSQRGHPQLIGNG